MKVLILGSNGLLGQSLLNTMPETHEVYCCSRGESKSSLASRYLSLDLTDYDLLRRHIIGVSPDIIINAAAYTHVDGCETDPLSELINVKLLRALVDLETPLVHISSDYVFDGENGPYSEKSHTHPINAYGRQKLASEEIVLGGCENIVVRTSWVYGKGNGLKMNYHDFVRSSLENGRSISVVDDQIGNPTFAPHLASVIWSMIDKELTGLYHVSGVSTLSRLDWAYRIANYYGLSRDLIKVIKTKDLGQLAARPKSTGFIVDKIKQSIPRVLTFTLQQQIDSYEDYHYEK